MIDRLASNIAWGDEAKPPVSSMADGFTVCLAESSNLAQAMQASANSCALGWKGNACGRMLRLLDRGGFVDLHSGLTAQRSRVAAARREGGKAAGLDPRAGGFAVCAES